MVEVVTQLSKRQTALQDVYLVDIGPDIISYIQQDMQRRSEFIPLPEFTGLPWLKGASGGSGDPRKIPWDDDNVSLWPSRRTTKARKPSSDHVDDGMPFTTPSGDYDEDTECCICMDKAEDPKALKQCGQLDEWRDVGGQYKITLSKNICQYINQLHQNQFEHLGEVTGTEVILRKGQDKSDKLKAQQLKAQISSMIANAVTDVLHDWKQKPTDFPDIQTEYAAIAYLEWDEAVKGVVIVTHKKEIERIKEELKSRGSVYGDIDCSICMKKARDPTALKQCGHIFCHECINTALSHKPVCPVCGDVVGKIEGDQPTIGRMSNTIDKQSLEGYTGCGTIIINYYFPDGMQEVTSYAIRARIPDKYFFKHVLCYDDAIPPTEKTLPVLCTMTMQSSRRSGGSA